MKQPVKQSEQRDGAVLPPSDELFGCTQHTNVDNAATATSLPQSAAPSPSRPAAHVGASSGLRVSGDLVFSPAPKTSPYFTGEPMHIHGFLEVEGYVDGDGNLHLVNAPFTRR